MARIIQDNPSGWSRSLPGHTVEYQAGFAKPFYYGGTITVAPNAQGTYTLTINDPASIFFIDVVNVTPQSYKEFAVLVYINDDNYVAGAFVGYCNIPLRQNPSIQLIDGDKIDIKVTNLDAAQRTFLVKLNGTKIARPAEVGTIPGAFFTVSAGPYSIAEDITFTDGSTHIPTSWRWVFDDGAESTDRSPVHHFDAAGTFSVVLTATNAFGSDTYAIDIVVVDEPANVDFTTFTEVDVGGVLTLSTTKIVGTAVPSNAAAYAYFDYGAAYFNAVDMYMRIKIPSINGNFALINFFGLSMSVGDPYPVAGYKMLIYFANINGVYSLNIAGFDGTTLSVYDSMTMSLNTDYWLHLTRALDSDIFVLKVYGDASHTSLIDTLTITQQVLNSKYRYLYGLSAYNLGIASTSTAETGDLEIV